MDTSIFLARLIGPLFLVMGAGMAIGPQGYRDMAHEFLASRALIYIAGLRRSCRASPSCSPTTSGSSTGG